jgi:hypothetical protein
MCSLRWGATGRLPEHLRSRGRRPAPAGFRSTSRGGEVSLDRTRSVRHADDAVDAIKRVATQGGKVLKSQGPFLLKTDIASTGATRAVS